MGGGVRTFLRRVAVGAVVGALAVAALAAGGQEGPESPPPAAPRDDPAARAARLAADVEQLAARQQEIAAFGHQAEFLTAVREQLGRAAGAKWIPLVPAATGASSASAPKNWLPSIILERYAAWSAVAAGRETIDALDWSVAHHPAAAIRDLAGQLERRGIAFLLVTFPGRVQIEPELLLPLPAWDGFRGMVAAQTAFLAELVKAGVEVVDLAPILVAAERSRASRRESRIASPGQADPPAAAELNDGLFLRGNLHWTPLGAELAAEEVARRIRALPSLEAGPLVPGRDFDVRPLDYTYHYRFSDGPDGAPAETMTARQVATKTPAAQDATRRDSPIVLLGDSFADFHSSVHTSFTWHLLRFTGWPIDLIATKGGGEMACRDALRRRGDALRGKRLVIWLLPEANLRPSPQFDCLDLFELEEKR